VSENQQTPGAYQQFIEANKARNNAFLMELGLAPRVKEKKKRYLPNFLLMRLYYFNSPRCYEETGNQSVTLRTVFRVIAFSCQ
jgi:hypothetical protein